MFAVTITSLPRLPKGFFTVSPDLFEIVNLGQGQQIQLKSGNCISQARFGGTTSQDPSRNMLYLSNDLIEELHLPMPVKLNLAINNDSLWQLGPLIAIFANRFSNRVKPFGEQSSFFRKLAAAARNLNALCFVISPADIDWQNKLINGAIPPSPDDNATGWGNHTFPFPDVVYDRGLFPKGDCRRGATQARKLLRHYPGMKLFNPAFFGKWKTHRLLSRNESLINHLPDTRLYNTVNDIFQILRKHQVAYLKPSSGSSGKGIIRLTATGDGILVNTRAAKKLTSTIVRDENLEEILKKNMSNRRYVVQQGLRLASLDNSPFDVRVLMQKNSRGQWLRTGMAARVAKPGSYISNLHAGGHAASLQTIIPKVFPETFLAQKVIDDIKYLSSFIAAWVSREGHPLFGEIAIDLGVDTDGKVWIIELNAIPGRSVFRRIGATELLSRAISRPMEYAVYLSGFTAGHYDK